MGLFLPGPANPNWRGGMRINVDGYRQVTAGPNRGKYEHRLVASRCMMETYGRELRPDEEVHHQNWVRSCNHDWNLIVMDEAIHHGINTNHKGRRKGNGNGKDTRFQKSRASNTGPDGQGRAGRSGSSGTDAD